MAGRQNLNVRHTQCIARGLRIIKKKTLMNMDGFTHQLTHANMALV
jgi:hypothetical protein